LRETPDQPAQGGLPRDYNPGVDQEVDVKRTGEKQYSPEPSLYEEYSHSRLDGREELGEGQA
jgi:hypothetical protein